MDGDAEGMLCSSVQEVVSGTGVGEVPVKVPVPVDPIAVEFAVVEYGGVVSV